MARKSNQQKSKVDRNSSNIKKTSSTKDCSVPDGNGQRKPSELKNILGEELRNGNLQDGNIPEARSKTRSAGEEEKTTQNSGNSVRKDQQRSKEPKHGEQSVLSGSDPMDLGTGTFGAGGDGGASPHLNSDVNHVNGSISDLINWLHFKNMVLENVDGLNGGMIRNLKASALSVSKVIGQWLERKKPLIIALRSHIVNACDLVRSKIKFAYPHVLKWLMHFGSILLLLSMVWLDCAIRGVDSFLRMGTTAFFSVLWCSIFSLIAMAGMLKFLIVLALAALVGVFIGITLGFLVLAIGGTVFLWIYGSFWTTMMFIAIGGLAFLLKHERLALFITTAYSVYCAWVYSGWLGLLLGLNLSFISSDALIYFLKSNIDQQRRADRHFEQSAGMQGQPNFFDDENVSSSQTGQGFASDRGPGVPSTSGCDSDMTSEDEVIRLLNCTDHYSALGFPRYQDIDVSVLKREYRKKAMLVHPDKNMGNEKAAEAFKKLQNAYEVLLDSLKRKEYDDELRREELLKYFRRFQSMSQKNGRNGVFSSGFPGSEADGEDPIGDSRRISCKKCNNFHVWKLTRKSKSRARWCQECNDFHQAKDRDGWVEQSSQPFLFGLMQKVDVPCAYVCADSKIYDVTEWYICQGMRFPANAHKPSFQVNTSLASKQSTSKGTSSGQRGSRMPNFNNVEEPLSEEELYEWLQNAMQSGMFDNFSGSSPTESSFPKASSSSKSGGGSSGSSGKRKKKGKKQW